MINNQRKTDFTKKTYNKNKNTNTSNRTYTDKSRSDRSKTSKENFDKKYETKDGLFLFKQKSQDFIVQENLPFRLEGKGDAFFVLFEKQNMTTMDIVNHLCKDLGISRLTLGIAGLKDKRAVTRQWISIRKRALSKIGGEKEFIRSLSEVARVMKTDRHTTPIGMTDHVKNTFYIRLRAKQKLSQDIRTKCFDKVMTTLTQGFPNYFGDQRFGINKQNPKQAQEILNKKHFQKLSFDDKFKLQAYTSQLFNMFLKERLKKYPNLLDGDILLYRGKHGIYDKKNNKRKMILDDKNNKFFCTSYKLGSTLPYDEEEMETTGPVFGYNTLLSPIKTLANQFESEFMRKNSINEKSFALFKQSTIFGLRRLLWINPKNIQVNFKEDDLFISFTLPGGSYASIVIDEILKAL